jgi:hypothetical protein
MSKNSYVVHFRPSNENVAFSCPTSLSLHLYADKGPQSLTCTFAKNALGKIHGNFSQVSPASLIGVSASYSQIILVGE